MITPCFVSALHILKVDLHIVICTLLCVLIASGLVAENCIVAAEGELQHNGIFKVGALGMPPNERRDESEAAAKVSHSTHVMMELRGRLIYAYAWHASQRPMHRAGQTS